MDQEIKVKPDIEFDIRTEAWFKKFPGARTTVAQCPKCKLWYKPSLGHKCKIKTVKE